MEKIPWLLGAYVIQIHRYYHSESMELIDTLPEISLWRTHKQSVTSD